MLRILHDTGLKENKFIKILKTTISNANVGNKLSKVN